MESKDELKEIDIKNRTCCYLDDKIRHSDRDIYFNDVLLDKKLYNNKKNNLWHFTKNFNGCKTVAY